VLVLASELELPSTGVGPVESTAALAAAVLASLPGPGPSTIASSKPPQPPRTTTTHHVCPRTTAANRSGFAGRDASEGEADPFCRFPGRIRLTPTTTKVVLTG
jgi:hypothetical protein